MPKTKSLGCSEAVHVCKLQYPYLNQNENFSGFHRISTPSCRTLGLSYSVYSETSSGKLNRLPVFSCFSNEALLIYHLNLLACLARLPGVSCV